MKLDKKTNKKQTKKSTSKKANSHIIKNNNKKIHQIISKKDVVEKANSLNEILSLVDNKKQVIDITIPAIEVNNYTKVFKKFIATENVNFSVNHGTIHGFIGPNGSGKTTTIKAMIGAYIPTKGELKINGHPVGTIAANKLIGYIPEKAAFPKHLNCIEYLKSMGELSGIKTKEAKVRATEILKALKMEKQAKRKPITFSSGMQKKILLAQSLLTNPSILILDEPAANLDPTTRKELFDELIQLRNQGKTILISSHILAELERIIDEATFIYYGEVIFSGKISDFNQSVSSIFVKTSNNKEFIKGLKKHKVLFDYELGGEIEITNVVKEDIDKMSDLIYKIIKETNNRVLSFRLNDLQSIYDELAGQAFKKKLGKQTLNGKSTVNSQDKKGEDERI